MVYVLNQNGKPLMPTDRCGKIRRLLKEEKAKVVKRTPFTVQLLYQADENLQPISLGVDAGSKTIGLSATTKDKVLFESEFVLRKDVTDLISTRRELRRGRRNRKTRYRQSRFLNRVRSKHKGWLAPSIENKIDTHMNAIRRMHQILPISHITVETAAFDTQLLKAQEYGEDIPTGTDYQQGEQLGFWNVREYVLFRDGHKCRCCKGKSKDPILNVHHIESRKTGGNAPNNLVTLCETCHKGYHKGTVTLPDNIRRGNKYNDAAFMGIMRWTFYDRLKKIYPNVHMTFGYITKNTRIRHNLPKEHYIDARCISGNPEAISDGVVYYQKQYRCHNRQIHNCSIYKGGVRKHSQNPKYVFGFRVRDKVIFEGKEYILAIRRTNGTMLLKRYDDEKACKFPSYKKIKLIERSTPILIERRKAVPFKTETSA